MKLLLQLIFSDLNAFELLNLPLTCLHANPIFHYLLVSVIICVNMMVYFVHTNTNRYFGAFQNYSVLSNSTTVLQETTNLLNETNFYNLSSELKTRFDKYFNVLHNGNTNPPDKKKKHWFLETTVHHLYLENMINH